MNQFYDVTLILLEALSCAPGTGTSAATLDEKQAPTGETTEPLMARAWWAEGFCVRATQGHFSTRSAKSGL